MRPPSQDAPKPDTQTQKWDNGLVFIPEFITREEEAAIIAAFHSAKPDAAGAVARRKRISQHFGHHFDYTTFGASETSFTPLPDYMPPILARLPVQEYLPDQFTVQYYPPGAGIPPHVDTHSLFSEALYSISLGSSVPMQFRRCNAADAVRMRVPKRSLVSEPDAAEAPKPQVTSSPPQPPASPLPKDLEQESDSSVDKDTPTELFLPPRSLLVMMGPSRYGYTHGIRGRKTDQIDGQTVLRQGRYSITMRTVRRGAEIGCDCSFPGVCDARIREEEEAEAAAAEKNKQ